jgi:hypothetical protein
MRFFSVLLAAICVAHINANAAPAAAEHAADEHLEPYHKHRDTRHGHDHVYPDRGSVVRDLPHGAAIINYAGLTYRFSEAVWYEARGPAYIVVAPPIGLLTTALPAFVTPFESGGQVFLYANDVYYRPRPDLGGYEVVNDPAEVAAAPAESGYVGGVAPSASSLAAAARAAAPPAAAAAAAPEAADTDPPVVSAAPIVAAVAAPAASAVPAATVSAVPAAAVSAVPATAAAAVPAPATTVTPIAAVAATPATALTARVASITSPAPVIPVATAGAAPLSPATVVAAPAPAVTVPPLTTPAVVPAVQSTSSPAPRSSHVMAYPRNGQSPDQQARDHYDCYQFAVAQTGFDPMRSNTGLAATQIAERQSDYDRAQEACFEGRGYTIR